MKKVMLYRVHGKMLISHDKLPEWRAFNLELTATSIEEAIEKVYSNLGSRHKLRRKHIRIESIQELDREEAISKYIKDLNKIEGWSQ